MHLALLQCDHITEQFLPVTGGDYDHLFRQHFAQFAAEVTLTAFDVTAGEYPAALNDFDGYLTTGSKASVYDDIAWVQQFKAYVRELYDTEKKFVGVCFGHQMMAEALGGRVTKSSNGWGIGTHQFEVIKEEAWMEPPLENYRVLMSCQDQVQLLPPDSIVLASSDFCPIAMYRVGSHFLGIQGHPEFTPSYSEALMIARADRIPAETIQAALKTLTLPLNRPELTSWMVNFIKREN